MITITALTMKKAIELNIPISVLHKVVQRPVRNSTVLNVCRIISHVIYTEDDEIKEEHGKK